MKQADILKIMAVELGTSKLDEINKALKAKNFSTKFRITGPDFVHFGFTGLLKALTPEGIKIYNVNKVNLVRYEDIETFAKAKPREERKGPPKIASETTAKPAAKSKVAKKFEDEDEEDYENDDDFDEFADEDDDVIEDDTVVAKVVTKEKKKPKKDTLHVPGSGSRFIPSKK